MRKEDDPKRRYDSWRELFRWLQESEIDAWEVKALVKDFCDENNRKYPKEKIVICPGTNG
jgi:hypothetical protein